MLKLASEGYTDKEMALALGISVNTVATYWKRLRERYPASSRTGLVLTLLKEVEEAEAGDSPPIASASTNAPGGEADGLPETLVQVLRAFSTGVLLADADGHIIYVNRQFSRILAGAHFDLLDARGQNLPDLLAEHWSDAHGSPWAKWMQDDFERSEARIHRAIGDFYGVPHCLDYTPIQEKERMVYHMWHVHPCALEPSGSEGAPNRRRMIEDSESDPGIGLTRTLEVRRINRAAERMLGVRAEQCVGRRVTEIHPAFQTPWFVQCVSEGALSRGSSGALEGLDGWFRVTGREDGHENWFTIQDVTDERKRLRSVISYSQFVKSVGASLPALIGCTPDSSLDELRKTVGSIAHYLRAERAGIFLFNPDDGRVTSIVSWRNGMKRHVTQLDFSPENPQYRWWEDKLESATVVKLKVRDYDPSLCENVRRLVQAGTEWVLFLPIRLEESIVGVIQFESGSSLRPVAPSVESLMASTAKCILAAMRRAGYVAS